MAADTTILQGEIMEDPADAKARELDVEALLTQLLRSLILEQTAEGEVQS